MAYQFYSDDQQDKDPTKAQQLGPSSTIITPGSTVGANGPGGGQINAQTPRPANKSQGFGRISNYLDANKGNSGNLGSSITNDLSTQESGLKSNIDTSFNKFQGDVTKGTNLDNGGLINEAKTNASAIVNDPTKKAAFGNLLAGKYNGPPSFTDYEDFKPNVKKYTDTASGITSGKGRTAYLQGQGQTFGNAALNNSLLGNNQAAINPINNFKTTLPDYLSGKEKAASDLVAQGQNQSLQTKNDLVSQFTGAGGELDKIKGAAQTQLDTLKGNTANLNKGIDNKIKGGDFANFSPAQIQALNLSQGDLAKFNQYANDAKGLGVNYDYSTAGKYDDPNVLTIDDAATPEQRAQSNALASLFGATSPLAATAGGHNAGYNFDAKKTISGLSQSIQEKIKKDLQKNAEDNYYSTIGKPSGYGSPQKTGDRSITKLVDDYLNGGDAEAQRSKYFGGSSNYNRQSFDKLLALLAEGKKKYSSYNDNLESGYQPNTPVAGSPYLARK
jgi:hypothetical protein